MKEIVHQQKQFFNSGDTRDIKFRKQQLLTVKKLLKKNEGEIFEALESDFNKPRFETYATELFVLYQEIDHLLENIDRWATPRKVKSSLINFPSKSYIYSQPYGVTLIISPWNYPLQLALNPALGAIAAGNTVILKPSEFSGHTTQLLAELFNNTFPADFFHVIEGGAETSQALLSQPLDYIFFTGSKRVGKLVMKAAAEQLTPLTIELGGKSPAIVDQTADLNLAAKRIVWGKFINAGQTCVSPDFIYIQESLHDQFCQLLEKHIRAFYGDDPSKNNDFARIINRKHFDRVKNLIDPQKIYYGGQTDEQSHYIEPTIMTNVSWHDAIMQEEIFGPVLPVLTFSELNEVIQILQTKPKPLSLYVFSNNQSNQQKIINNLQFGSGCINDTVAHLGNLNLPFGGIGDSGFGSYHGKQSFDTFSHQKSIMKKSNWLDIPLRYPPYDDKLKWLKKLTKFL
ncbi:MAG: aldehyde dehydrogenase [Bacteroidota bacterium]